MWHLPPSLIFSFIILEIKMLRFPPIDYTRIHWDTLGYIGIYWGTLPLESSRNPTSDKTVHVKSESTWRMAMAALVQLWILGSAHWTFPSPSSPLPLSSPPLGITLPIIPLFCPSPLFPSPPQHLLLPCLFQFYI